MLFSFLRIWGRDMGTAAKAAKRYGEPQEMRESNLRFIENDATIKVTSNLPGKVEEADTTIGHTVYAEYHHYVVHWYENNGKVPECEIKLKGAK